MERTFLNPYHFIPMQDKKSDYEANADKISYTGVLSYEITTKGTPLFIPG